MEIHVYDTWVEGSKGTIHFDVFLPNKDDKKAVESARKFLDSIGEKNAKVSSKECSFCHSQGTTKEVEDEIKKNGFYIYKMKGC